jgi:hypothetical protein
MPVRSWKIGQATIATTTARIATNENQFISSKRIEGERDAIAGPAAPEVTRRPHPSLPQIAGSAAFAIQVDRHQWGGRFSGRFGSAPYASSVGWFGRSSSRRSAEASP